MGEGINNCRFCGAVSQGCGLPDYCCSDCRRVGDGHEPIWVGDGDCPSRGGIQATEGCTRPECRPNGRPVCPYAVLDAIRTEESTS